MAFYASQARERLQPSRAARLLARAVLRMAWTPVGSGIMLPGLAGMHLVSRAAAGYGVGPDAAGRATGPVQRAGSMLWSLLRCPSLSR